MADRDINGRYLPAHSIPGPGRTSIYDPAMNEVARKLSLLGHTDEELAGFFEIDTATIYRWRHDYPAFCEAINAGKVIADAEVAASLYRRAVGEEMKVEKIVKNSAGEHEVLTVTQYVPGDVAAAKHWLGNRQRARWTNRDDSGPQESVRQDLHNGEAITVAVAKLRAELKLIEMIEDAV